MGATYENWLPKFTLFASGVFLQTIDFGAFFFLNILVLDFPKGICLMYISAGREVCMLIYKPSDKLGIIFSWQILQNKWRFLASWNWYCWTRINLGRCNALTWGWKVPFKIENASTRIHEAFIFFEMFLTKCEKYILKYEIKKQHHFPVILL